MVIDVEKYADELNRDFNDFVRKHLKSLLNGHELSEQQVVICALNKIDLLNEMNRSSFGVANSEDEKNKYFSKISCIDELNGIDELLSCLKIQIANM